MSRDIEHHNILTISDEIKDKVQTMNIVCRGCTMRNRDRLWLNFVSSVNSEGVDNSYIVLVEEPSNKHDKNAVYLQCKGAFYGQMGYVAKELALEVKSILSKC